MAQNRHLGHPGSGLRGRESSAPGDIVHALRHIVGTTVRIARSVKTKIGIVDHIDEKAHGEFERNVPGGTQVPGAFLRTSGMPNPWA